MMNTEQTDETASDVPETPRKQVFDVTSETGATMYVEASCVKEARMIASNVGLNVGNFDAGDEASDVASLAED
jgi:hypothetical protein